MAWVGSTVATQVVQLLSETGGLNACLGTLALAENVSLPALAAQQIVAQNVTADLAERSTEVVYPAVNVYCAKIVNQLTEKFRIFSGVAVITISVRVSQDRLGGIENQAQMYVDGVTQVLDQNRGDWGKGMYYAGGYEADFGPVKHGGKNFIQEAKVTFEIGVSN